MADSPNDRPRWIQRIVRRLMHNFHDQLTGEEPEEAYLIHWGDTNQKTYHRAVEIRRDYPHDVAIHFPQFYELENGQLRQVYPQEDVYSDGSRIGGNEGNIVNTERPTQKHVPSQPPPSQPSSTTPAMPLSPQFRVIRCAECAFAHKRCVGPVPTCERCAKYGISSDKCFYKPHGKNK